jgi:hypothetical protein
VTKRPEVPNPGTPEAIRLGCRCPVVDNGRGKGYMGMPGVFVFNCDCPVHHPAPPPAATARPVGPEGGR